MFAAMASTNAAPFSDSRVLAIPRANTSPLEWAATAHPITRIGAVAVCRVPEGSTVLAEIARLRRTGRFSVVEPDYEVSLDGPPDDPRFPDQLNLQGSGGISASDAWNTVHSASSVVVAIIDTGIVKCHRDLEPNLWTNPCESVNGKYDNGNGYIDDVHGADVTGGNDLGDRDGHGTRIASIIGAKGNNSRGMTGVVWSIPLMIIRAFADESSTTPGAEPTARKSYVSRVIAALRYARKNGGQVINASYGQPFFSAAEYAELKAARDAGVVIVASGGNDGHDLNLVPHYPASYPLDNIVAVANHHQNGNLCQDNNWGSGIMDLAAPGESILGYSSTSDHATPGVDCTSFAAPHVTGALALLGARFPCDTYRQRINRLLRAVEPMAVAIDQPLLATGGRLNLARAVVTTDSRPFNDDFAASATLATSQKAAEAYVTARGSNVGATREPGEQDHAPGIPGDATLWWRWHPAVEGEYTLTTRGSEFDTLLSVWTGDAFGSLVRIAANDDEPGFMSSRVTFKATTDKIYHLALAGKNGSTGGFSLALGIAPSNDSFSHPVDLATTPAPQGPSFEVNGHLRLASRDPDEASFSIPGTGRTVWYRWEPTLSGTWTISVKAHFAPVVAVFDAQRQLLQSDANPDAEAPAVTRTFAAGTTYFIGIDSQNAGVGEFTLLGERKTTPTASVP